MKTLIIIIMLLLTCCVYAATPVPVNTVTQQNYWYGFRSNDPASTFVTVAETALTTTTKTWATKGDTFKAPDAFNNVTLRFRSTVAATTGVFEVYVYTSKDDAVHVCDVNMVAGAMVSSWGGVYADTLSLDDDDWATDIVISEGDAADGMGRISFDLLGYEYVYAGLKTVGDANGFTTDIRGF